MSCNREDVGLEVCLDLSEEVMLAVSVKCVRGFEFEDGSGESMLDSGCCGGCENCQMVNNVSKAKVGEFCGV